MKMIAQDFTRVPNDLADPQVTVSSPGFWRLRISSVAPRWMPALPRGPPCPWSCHPYWGHHSARPPRCHPLYFRSRSGYPCRAAHCSLRKGRGERNVRNVRSCNIRLIRSSRKSRTSLLLATFFLWPAGSLEKCV